MSHTATSRRIYGESDLSSLLTNGLPLPTCPVGETQDDGVHASRSVDLRTMGACVLHRCRELARITEVPGQTTRTFLSPATREAHNLLTSWFQEAGLDVTIDAIGNLHASRPTPPGTPRLLIGSHLDTVIDAGAFDGILGILLGLALVETLGDTTLPFQIDLVAFSEEEGVRFRKPFLGSLSLIGDPPPLTLTDNAGITLAQAIAHFGHTPTTSSLLHPDTFAYLEFHIEQGPVLDAGNRPIAAVSAIAGQTRLQLTFRGQANHAGTTPMSLRHDALAAAAQWIVAVETSATTCPGLVATVGSLEVKPNLGNVIAGEVIASLDIRHVDDASRMDALARLLQAANEAAAQRGVTCASEKLIEQPAVPLDSALTGLLTASARACGFDACPMPSGAGHDALILARRIPAAMLFLRTPQGLSHHPEESVLSQDVEAALATGLTFLRQLTLEVVA